MPIIFVIGEKDISARFLASAANAALYEENVPIIK